MYALYITFLADRALHVELVMYFGKYNSCPIFALRMVASCRQLQSCEIQNSAKTAIKAAGKVNIPSLFQSPCFFFFHHLFTSV